ncbi:MAG: hypothetical protein MUE80_07420 [Acidobacteria bacterium]|jgi:hypothetical protein|nr:hypothetical protein [Acidobacteriota bacterium]
MRDSAPGLKAVARILLPVAAFAFVATLLMRHRLPGPDRILEPLLQAPVQTTEDVPEPFDVTRKDIVYTVTPLYSYELWGLVVSYHHSASFVDISHRQWKDFLNTKDVCVLWGRNVETGVYKRMRFRNRDFTCYYRYPDRETGELFTENALSNNHLLPADPLVAAAVKKARTGDQVRFKGWLVSYGIKGSPYARRSSTVRNDRGNGACEVVYVTEFEVLREGNAAWRALNKLALVAGGLALAALIFL